MIPAGLGEAAAARAAQSVMRHLMDALADAPRHPSGTPMSAYLTHADVDLLAAALPSMPYEVKLELSALLAHVPAAPDPIPFRDFVARAKPDYRWYAFAEPIHERLMDVAEGRLTRLMIFAPPRAGKSELVSRLFTSYYQYRFPHRFVGLCSYGDDLAFTLARASRENYLRGGGTLGGLRDTQAVKQINTGHAGGMWAAGVGGPITGKGFHLGVIDDPLKNSQEAKSAIIRAKHKDWWQGTFYTRREPTNAIVLIMTPWHEDDLGQWLLRRETADEHSYPERWHIIALDAIRTPSEPYFVPSTCTLEPDPRPAGAPLVPERYPLAELLKTRQSVGSYYWSAMYQARPKPADGNMFKRDWFSAIRAIPSGIDLLVRYWDIAGTDKKDATEHDPDFTRSVLIGRYRTRLASDSASETGEAPAQWRTRFVILHANGGQLSPLKRDDLIVATTEADARQFGRGVVANWLECDPGVGGEERTKAIISKLAGHRARYERAPGQSKTLRAEPFQAQAEARNVDYLVGDWNAEFFVELCGFPYAAHDDYVDAAAGAFAKVSTGMSGDAMMEVIPAQRSAPLMGVHDAGDTAADAISGLGPIGGIFGPSVGVIGG